MIPAKRSSRDTELGNRAISKLGSLEPVKGIALWNRAISKLGGRGGRVAEGGGLENR